MDAVQKKALEYLRSQKWAVLSTVSKEREPQVAVMNFLVDDSFNFYFITTNKNKKIENIKLNNKVGIAVGFGPEPITIQAGGRAKIVEDVTPELFTTIFHFIPNQDISKWPIVKLAKSSFSTIVVEIDWMTWLNLDKKGHPETYSEDFIHVI